ncbi:double-strand break repair helicase AddA [Sphingomonas nostoxanthinifaciens]|uniref:double-strand break repair helicase AddA n=1 Tax=Sphingomonas nostoxanthinifaciens TaxID=2872652 RepID=UPI001CC1FC81|nr:double-strand break repair helicase AddA [Sphingomonas nostoxanthinifaciens]UAK25136.1 double-strand break repair helicase AddA [Sphingomonas nostoxanthinifaciens]
MSGRLSPLQRLEGHQAAASRPDAQVWLSASAGTGKTHVLTARVLRLLLNGAPPESILCLTFTKAGAAEMAERIQARLARWVRLPDVKLRKELWALDEPRNDDAVARARRLFARVLDAPGGGLRIQTIHAFCQTLLAGFPAEAGLTPGFRPLEGRAEAALARATLAELLADAERNGDLGLGRDVAVLSRRLGEQAAERYLRLCARAPDALAALGMREGIEARTRTALDVPLGDVEAAIEASCADDAFDCATLHRIVGANRTWGTKTGLEHADLGAAFLAADAPARAAMLGDLIGLARTKQGEPRSFGAKLLGCDPDHGGNCERLAEAIDRLLSLRSRAALAADLAAGLRAGQTYAAAYAVAKRAQGAVDFDDLIRLTVALLDQPGIGAWIRFKLDRRTDHILVDEGQDTNVAQWKIVDALADEFFSEDPDELSRAVRTIFSVGDFKQAIFGFQGTNPYAFARAREHFARAAEAGRRTMERLSLDRSFRSTPPVLELVDTLIARVGADRLGLLDAAEPHRSAKAHLPGMVSLWQPVSLDIAEDADDVGEEGWIDDAQRLFAQKLAEQVRDWLDAPLWLAGRERALRPEDVLVLVRKRGALASLIVARLHAEGVPVAGVDRLRLDAPLAVKDLMATIRFVLQPEDDLNLAGLLVSPLFGLDQDALYAVAFRRPGSLWSAVADDPACAEAASGLRLLLARADLTTPYRFLEEILSGARDGRRRLMRRLGPEARDPIEELLNAALTFEREATPTLQRFLDWFDRDEIEVTRDPSAPLDAVRVMTVHGAKGLQAPLVILADATGDPDMARAGTIDWPMADDDGPVPVFRPRKAELHGTLADALAAAQARERAEHWRLLYVALTRAEERLVIGGALGPRARGVAPAESWYAEVEQSMAALGAEPLADPRWGARRDHGVAAVPTTRRAAPAAVAAASTVPDWLRAPAPVEQRPPRPLAPSSLGEDDVADPPPGPAARAAAERGRLLHALFERLPAFPSAERAAAGQRWLERSAGIADAALRERLVTDACAIIAEPRFAELFAPDALAEAPIAAVLANGIVVAGTVDRLLVTEDRVLLVDFKTGRRVPLDAADAPTHHLRQMAAYAEALAVIFPGRAIEPALLYTAGPRLIPLAPELLAAHKPGLGLAEQKLGADG